MEEVEQEQQADPEQPDLEAQAEQFVEAEQQLRENTNHPTATNEAAHTLDLRPPTPSDYKDIATADVITGRKHDGQFEITAVINGDQTTLSVPWPDDPTDPDAPLYRLCRWNEVSPAHLTALSEIPVVRVDGEWHVLAPPVKETSAVHVAIPGDIQHTFTYPSNPSSRFFTGILTRLLNTPLLELKWRNREALIINWRAKPLTLILASAIAFLTLTTTSLLGFQLPTAFSVSTIAALAFTFTFMLQLTSGEDTRIH